MMREYKLPAAYFAKVRTRVLVWTLLISSIAATAGIRIAMALIGWLDNASHLPASVLSITVVFVVIALMVGLRIGLRRVQRSWESYRLILDENSIRRVQEGYPEITIQSSEISRITEAEGRGLIVHSVKPYTDIGIPRAVQEYAEIRADLEKKHAIERISGARGKAMAALVIAIGLLTPVALLIIFLATNKLIGTLLFSWLLASVVIVQRSGSASKQAKRISWLVSVPLLAIAIRVLFVIANW
jgi:lysylphosphatidylglycerol synthetase-like protein (DUF2156 family)